jgi:ABC-type glutathione transport system ATPase component
MVSAGGIALYVAPMPTSKALTQSIAVFGESGSGKTVLLSSFYGASQEPGVVQANPFRVVADSVGQGNALQQNYLKMKNSAQLPQTNRFSSTTYSFSIKLKANGLNKK